jgi:TonB family protein
MLAYFLKVNALISLVYLCYLLGLKGKSGLMTQRLFLLLGSFLSLLGPFLSINPSSSSQLLAGNYLLDEVLVKVETTETNIFQWDHVLFLSYCILSLYFLCRFLYALLKLSQLRRKGLQREQYIELPGSKEAFSFFHCVFIGENIAPKDLPLILQHEGTHVRYRHTYDLLFYHLLIIFFWLNPFLWLMRKDLLLLHELQADDACSNHDNQYVQLLLSQHFQTPHFSIIHSFNQKPLKHRIMRIVRKPQHRFQGLKVILSTLFLSSFIFFSMSVKTSAKTPQTTGESTFAKGDPNLPSFPGGKRALVEFFNEHLKVPTDLKGSAKAIIEFTVNEEGKCLDFSIKKSAGEELDNAAIECMKKMPNWIPAEKEGKKVSSKMTLPVVFTNEHTGSYDTVPFNSLFYFEKAEGC